MIRKKPAIIYGDGSQERCFSDIDDVVDPIVKSINSTNAIGETINIGPDEDVITIKDLAFKILKVLNSDLEPIFVDPRPQEVKLAHCSADKARKLLNYRTTTSLRDGIVKTYEYIKQRGTKEFDYNINLEIINDLTPETWKKKEI